MCSGCYRTGREIVRWRDMTEKEQWDLLAELEKRKPQNKTDIDGNNSPKL